MNETNRHTAEDLRQFQALPLDMKITMTKRRLLDWTSWYDSYISFSGGKDSTVLKHIADSMDLGIPAVFVNTGLEYPELQRFVYDIRDGKYSQFDSNVEILRPAMRFDEVISKYGYPLISKEVAEAIYYARKIRSQNSNVERERTSQRKRQELNMPKRCGEGKILAGKTGEGGVFSNAAGKDFGDRSMFNKAKWKPLCDEMPVLISHHCCGVMKKSPAKEYARRTHQTPILATMAVESRIRKQAWIRHGCNAFGSNNPTSQPMSFWTEQDVLAYIKRYGLPIAPVYGEIVEEDSNGQLCVDGCGTLRCTGCNRTWCIFCGFGFHLEKGETRFQRLARTHPRQYEYCLGGGQWVDNPNYDAAAPVYDGEWKNWNPKKIWVPSKEGLGMKAVFDMANEIYGKNFYRYD